MRQPLTTLVLIAAAALSVAAAEPAPSDPRGAISGRVIDAATGDPVESAVVTATWWTEVLPNPAALVFGLMFGGHGGSDIRVAYAAEALTDRDGRFEIPAWTLADQWYAGYIIWSGPIIHFFARGYSPAGAGGSNWTTGLAGDAYIGLRGPRLMALYRLGQKPKPSRGWSDPGLAVPSPEEEIREELRRSLAGLEADAWQAAPDAPDASPARERLRLAQRHARQLLQQELRRVSGLPEKPDEQRVKPYRIEAASGTMHAQASSASNAPARMGYGFFGASSYSAKAIEAWVVDADTSQPLEGVNVVAHWELNYGLEGGGAYQMEIMETVTDARGRFTFPAWGPKSVPQGLPAEARLQMHDPEILLFKPGYHARYRTGKEDRRTLGDFAGRGPTLREWYANGDRLQLVKFESLSPQALAHAGMDKMNPLERQASDVGFFDSRLQSLVENSGCGWLRVPRAIASVDTARRALAQKDEAAVSKSFFGRGSLRERLIRDDAREAAECAASPQQLLGASQ